MWCKIIGSLFIVSGVAFAANPERLRKRIQKKGLRMLRRYLVVAASSAGILLISAGWQLDGALAKVFTGAGILLLLKGVHLLKAKSTDIMAARLMELPTLYLRVFAGGQIVLGLVIVLLRNE